MSLINLLLGRPLASDEARAEYVGPAAGIPIFGLDALSSAAYGPEAALTLLIPLGAAGIAYMVPISVSIIVLLIIVYFSYCQTIQVLSRRRRVTLWVAAAIVNSIRLITYNIFRLYLTIEVKWPTVATYRLRETAI